MTPKAALKRFTEKYPTEALVSLQELSNDLSLRFTKFESVELTESAERFGSYLDGYVEFKTERGEPEVTNTNILEGTDRLINRFLLKGKQENCSGALDFVLTYLEGLKTLDAKLDEETSILFEREAKPEDVGLLSIITENYVDALTEKVDTVMERLLRLSGYTSNRALREASRMKPKRKSKYDDYFL